MILLTGCAVQPYLYLPDNPNMPLASNKGEIKGNLALGTDGGEIQGSYCIDSHVVVCANISYSYIIAYKAGAPADYPPNKMGNYIGDISSGYYTKISHHGRFELLGGAGYGYTNSYAHNIWEGLSNDPLVIANCRFAHLFAQADIGVVKRNIDFGFGIRLSDLLTSGTASFSTFDKGNLVSTTNGTLNGSAAFLEPCIMLSFGADKIKLKLSAGFSARISGHEFPILENFDYGSSYDPLFASAGLEINLFRK